MIYLELVKLFEILYNTCPSPHFRKTKQNTQKSATYELAYICISFAKTIAD
jgi:hypothetical protein